MFDANNKRILLAEYAKPYQVFIETGLYQARGSGYGLTNKYIVIDMQKDNCIKAKENYPDAQIFCGDSGEILVNILKDVNEPSIFWLDAHLVIDYDGTEALNNNPVPLLRELEAICNWSYARESTILIDDVRLFGGYGWPKNDDIFSLTYNWNNINSDDILILTPKDKSEN